MLPADEREMLEINNKFSKIGHIDSFRVHQKMQRIHAHAHYEAKL